VGYVVPKDREPRPDHAQRLRWLVTAIQRFYADQMERHGFGRKTFAIESDDAGTPRVHVVRSERTVAEIAGTDGNTFWNGVVEAARAGGVPAGRNPGEIWFLVSAATRQEANGLSAPDYALGNRGSNDNGIAIVQDTALVFGTEAMLASDADLHGKTLPELGPFAIDRVAYKDYQSTVASWLAGNSIGAAAHELGHAFRLSHQYRNDGAWGGAAGGTKAQHYGTVMGNAFRGYRGYARPGDFAVMPTPEDCRLSRSAALLLNLSPFFDRARARSDRAAPRLTLGLPRGTVAPTAGLVEIPFVAEDTGGSGVALAIAFNGDGDVAYLEYPDRPQRVEGVLRTPHFAAGRTSEWRVRVLDGDFNEAQSAIPLTVAPVSNAAPRPFIVTPTNLVRAGATVSFNASKKTRDPEGDALTYRWDFGDGATSDAADPVHTFSKTGPLTVRLRVTDAKGASAEEEMQLRVQPAGAR
jgi:hypothetical protein